MLLRLFPVLLLATLSLTTSAQLTVDLVAHYSFDNNDQDIIIDETGTIANNGFSTSSTYGCGTVGRALRLNGTDDQVLFEGTLIKDLFDRNDLSISFYFKAFNSNQVATQTIMSKRDDCGNVNAFAVRYSPNNHSLNVILSENSTLNTILSVTLDETNCWHHVVIRREGTRVDLFVDGLLAATDNNNSRIDLSSDALPFNIGKSSCTATDGYFDGFIDEVRLYKRAISNNEVKALYVRPDRIGNGFVDLGIPKDTIIYLGNSFQPFITSTCVDQFQWQPAIGISDATLPDPVITPTETTTYTLSFIDEFGCIASDDLLVEVIDPETLDCEAFLPSAFTPNNDGLNDSFGVDNPFALTDFVSLEIFDRWGSRIFYSEDAFLRWDGTYAGKILNPGVFLYKVQYRCSGEDQRKTGQITLIR